VLAEHPVEEELARFGGGANVDRDHQQAGDQRRYYSEKRDP
jgi:hypothetical protein